MTPEIEELRRRVEAIEAEIGTTLDQLGEAARNAVDWRKLVSEHPVESAVGAAVVGFAVGYQPDLLARQGSKLVDAALTAGSETLVRTILDKLGSA